MAGLVVAVVGRPRPPCGHGSASRVIDPPPREWNRAILPPWRPSPARAARSPSRSSPASLHLVVGFYYLAGGLVVPGYVLVPLWVVWFLLAWWLVTLARRNSWWTPLAPVAAAVLFVVVITRRRAGPGLAGREVAATAAS